MPLKIGTTYFKNTEFIIHALKEGKIDPGDIEFHYAHPPQLGKMLEEGSLDIAPTSSIIYARNNPDLLVLPEFSINALGETMSILLFSKNFKSLEELEGKKIAVPGTSASSSALLEIILKMKGIKTEIIYHKSPDLVSMLGVADAALLIGDQALKANYSSQRIIADLGEAWKGFTGKKMVYALWVIRKGIADRYPGEVQEFYGALKKSREFAYREMDTLSQKLAGELGVSGNFLKEHLNKLDYTLGRRGIEGLTEYFRQAHNHGILSSNPRINFFEVH